MIVSGSVQEKKGRLYYIFRVKDESGLVTQHSRAMHLDARTATEKQKREAIREIERMEENNTMLFSNNIRFVDFIDKWLTEIKEPELESNTLDGYKSYIKHHVRPFFEPRKVTLQRVSGAMIQTFYTHLRQSKGLSVSSIRKIRAVVHGPLEWAFQLGVIPENPAKRARIPRDRNRNEIKNTAYTAEEVRHLFALTKDEDVFPAIYLATCFGLRRSEVIGLSWDKIDLAARTMHICQVVVCQNRIEVKQRTKTPASNRVLPISDPAADFLHKLWTKQQRERREHEKAGTPYDNNDFVCKHSDGRPFQPTFVSHKFDKLIKAHDLRKITFHGLRHTAITLLIHSGHDPKSVQEFAGHADLETTLGIYTHASQGLLRNAVEDLGTMLASAP